eukprot:TRINITY_DN6386_c0_g1_i1.p1 TRINITY_DN6386_c0_g1~~TRINITY_DN6386_c0_g1_i1.p1  ORF type:complete len:323 (+),score=64.64 TRINITY_DN6386_c0_g1_i1:64-1032(+)
MAEELDFPPTIQNIIEQDTLKYIFVGGKGGVGKSTCSSCLAIRLAEAGRRVLLISTDPAHNLSDAFNQKFGPRPVAVEGLNNLSCMEIDPVVGLEDHLTKLEESNAEVASFLKDIGLSIPGIDEATSFSQIIKLVKSMDYDVTVFDTAPTGHTLRLLQMPGSINKAIDKVLELDGNMGGMLSQMGSMMNMGDASGLIDKLQSAKASIEEVTAIFKNPDETTFVCICIAEFLSLYETERLIQELTRLDLDTHNIIINQLIVPDPSKPCDLCTARHGIQKKYLDQIDELYDDFHVVKLPLQPKEVRGLQALTDFSKLMLQKLDL